MQEPHKLFLPSFLATTALNYHHIKYNAYFKIQQSSDMSDKNIQNYTKDLKIHIFKEICYHSVQNLHSPGFYVNIWKSRYLKTHLAYKYIRLSHSQESACVRACVCVCACARTRAHTHTHVKYLRTGKTQIDGLKTVWTIYVSKRKAYNQELHDYSPHLFAW
jgi:hypothetical protein